MFTLTEKKLNICLFFFFVDESAKQLVSLFQTTAENIFINFFVNSITKVSNRSIISKLDLEDLVKYIIMPPESPIKEVIENTSSEMNVSHKIF